MRASPTKVHSHRMSRDNWTSKGSETGGWFAIKGATRDPMGNTFAKHGTKPKAAQKLTLKRNESDREDEYESNYVETPTNSTNRPSSIPNLEDVTLEGSQQEREQATTKNLNDGITSLLDDRSSPTVQSDPKQNMMKRTRSGGKKWKK